jgi:hypothetical protein
MPLRAIRVRLLSYVCCVFRNSLHNCDLCDLCTITLAGPRIIMFLSLIDIIIISSVPVTKAHSRLTTAWLHMIT